MSNSRAACCCSQPILAGVLLPCSVAVFDEGELGTPLKPEELPPHVAARMAAAQRVAAPVAAQVGVQGEERG